MNPEDHRQKEWIGGWNFNACHTCNVASHGALLANEPPLFLLTISGFFTAGNSDIANKLAAALGNPTDPPSS